MTDRATVNNDTAFWEGVGGGAGLSDNVAGQWGFSLTSQSDSSLVLHSQVYLLMVF